MPDWLVLPVVLAAVLHKKLRAKLDRAPGEFAWSVRHPYSLLASGRPPAPRGAAPSPFQVLLRGGGACRTRARPSLRHTGKAWSAPTTEPPPAPRSPPSGSRAWSGSLRGHATLPSRLPGYTSAGHGPGRYPRPLRPWPRRPYPRRL